MKISIYIRNREDGASHYRIYQYVNGFEDEGIKYKIREFSFNYLQFLVRKVDGIKSLYYLTSLLNYIIGTNRRIIQLFNDLYIYKPDVVYIQREVFPKKAFFIGLNLLRKLSQSSTKLIWDFDDNIYINGEISKKERNILEKNSSVVTVPSQYLKNKLPEEFKNKVILLPTTDCQLLNLPLSQNITNKEFTFQKEIRVLWIGSYGNLKHLDSIAYSLDLAAKKLKINTGKKVVLEIVCNKPFNYKFSYLSVENTKWSRKSAIVALKNSHIGIMPLNENDFTLGKAGFKAVQYLGAGIPTIMSEVGFNKLVIKNGESGYFACNSNDWIESIGSIGSDIAIYKNMAILARKRWEEKFNSLKTFNEIIKLILN